MSIDSDVLHPGARIRAEVIPRGMTVTKAAQLMGVGRSALSNLLNGNASLSAQMAARLEKAFSYPLKDLMEMQAQYDATQAQRKDVPADTKAYVPPFLAIKAHHIEEWVSHNIVARSRLAVFLRTLVHSTASGLAKVDFPGNDDAERPGWDGFVDARVGTPWVPAGHSGWEFGTNAEPAAKATRDFQKSVKALSKKERAQITFVFVTPRRWTGKVAWVVANKAKGLWKDVRAYDASDLEQWLEQSLPAQAWFANERCIPAQHVRSLDKCWADWANVSAPPLTGALFSAAIEATKRTMLSRLSKPPEGPILIAADSTEEAIAFLAQLLGERGGEQLAEYRDRVLVFDKPGVLPRLAAAAQTFIPVVFTREVERELAPYARSMHSFVIYPRNAVTTDPAIVLELTNYETFNKGLGEMGKDRDQISRLASASGRSLTVLRRQLSTVDAVRIPEWAANRQAAESLVPFLFVGAWNSQNETDRIGLSLLAGRPYEDLEKECQSLAQLNDAPIWSIGSYRGVISKIDLLYAIAGIVTPDDLKHYFSVAGMVLGEDNPALDLDESRRWAAPIYGKTREFSSPFRDGISETLVLLAVHGHLFKSRLGIDVEIEAMRVVRELLPAPLTTRVLEANDRDLPTYAETAPDVFLSTLERDLKSDNPAVIGLLRPAGSDVFWNSPSRTGLLWALEGLSWNPETLPRAVFILARLAQVEINDNWTNKPTRSLQSIFRAWMPQTAANHQQRVDLMKELAKKFPQVAWKICVAQFAEYHHVGDYNHKPRWRPDGYGFGEPFPTWGPIVDFVREMVEMALTWKDHSLPMLCDLVERLQGLSETDQSRVWELVESWANTRANDADKASLREKIRISILSRRAALRAKDNGTAKRLVDAGRAAYAALEPSDILNKHIWLFRDAWVEESADEVDEVCEMEKFDIREREDRINKQRIASLHEIIAERGVAGIVELSERGNASWVIGMLAVNVLSDQGLQELLQCALAPIFAGTEKASSHKNLVGGVLRAIKDEDKREAVLSKCFAMGLSEDNMAKLLVLAPYGKTTWKLADALGDATQTKYWNEVIPEWIPDSDAESNESVERLLKAERPRAAFACIRLDLGKVDAEVLFRLLSAVAQGGSELSGEYMLEKHRVEEAFRHLNKSQAVTFEQKAALEFAYIESLSHSWGGRNSYGIPNLERYVEAHPELFVQAIAWTYPRKDGATDPVDLQVPPDQVKTVIQRSCELLDAVKRIPGHNAIGELEATPLAKWITTVRQRCAELGRIEAADARIGKVLSLGPVGKDGIWPCEAVRDVMEDIQSEFMTAGARTGVYNARGAHWRGEGGGQERELAARYRKWSEALQISHPFVAARLLGGLAKMYDHQASHEDTDAGIRRRLR